MAGQREQGTPWPTATATTSQACSCPCAGEPRCAPCLWGQRSPDRGRGPSQPCPPLHQGPAHPPQSLCEQVAQAGLTVARKTRAPSLQGKSGLVGPAGVTAPQHRGAGQIRDWESGHTSRLPRTEAQAEYGWAAPSVAVASFPRRPCAETLAWDPTPPTTEPGGQPTRSPRGRHAAPTSVSDARQAGRRLVPWEGPGLQGRDPLAPAPRSSRGPGPGPAPLRLPSGPGTQVPAGKTKGLGHKPLSAPSVRPAARRTAQLVVGHMLREAPRRGPEPEGGTQGRTKGPRVLPGVLQWLPPGTSSRPTAPNIKPPAVTGRKPVCKRTRVLGVGCVRGGGAWAHARATRKHTCQHHQTSRRRGPHTRGGGPQAPEGRMSSGNSGHRALGQLARRAAGPQTRLGLEQGHDPAAPRAPEDAGRRCSRWSPPERRSRQLATGSPTGPTSQLTTTSAERQGTGVHLGGGQGAGETSGPRAPGNTQPRMPLAWRPCTSSQTAPARRPCTSSK
uniref:Uncharacterized protein n=1 Tax=Mustela putorius furo TaxID=9669 RepID=M3Z804_MUSPF